MAPRKKTAVVVMNILLLFSLQLHPIVASRMALGGGRSQAAEQSGDGVEAAEQSGDGVDFEAFSQMFQSEREEMEALAEAEARRFCGWGYSRTMRYFHFEFDVAGQGKDAVRHFAAELIRAPKAPRLIMHAGRTWSTRLTDDWDNPIDWVLSPLPDHSDATYSIQIDFLYEVQYIKMLDGNSTGIEIKFNNGTNLEISGGLYYPEKVLARALYRVGDKKSDDPPDVAAKDANRNASAAGHAISEGGGVLGNAIANHGKSFAAKGAVGGVAVGFGLSYGFSSALVLMNGILNAFLAHIGAGAYVSIQIGIAPLTAAQIFSFTSTAGTVGLAGGAALGLGIGLILGIPAGAATMISQWIRQRRELRLSASEKIFAKLTCHRHFKRCGWGGKILAPEGKTCPKLKKNNQK